MTVRKLVVIAVVAFAAFTLVTTIAVYLLWSSGDDPPAPSQAVTTLRS